MSVMRIPMMLLLGLIAIQFLTVTASAGPLDNVQDGLADSLDTTSAVAGLILSAAIILSAALTMSVAKVPTSGIFMVLLIVAITLVVISWLPTWTLVLIALFAASQFASWMGGYLSKAGGGDGNG